MCPLLPLASSSARWKRIFRALLTGQASDVRASETRASSSALRHCYQFFFTMSWISLQLATMAQASGSRRIGAFDARQRRTAGRTSRDGRKRPELEIPPFHASSCVSTQTCVGSLRHHCGRVQRLLPAVRNGVWLQFRVPGASILWSDLRKVYVLYCDVELFSSICFVNFPFNVARYGWWVINDDIKGNWLLSKDRHWQLPM